MVVPEVGPHILTPCCATSRSAGASTLAEDIAGGDFPYTRRHRIRGWMLGGQISRRYPTLENEKIKCTPCKRLRPNLRSMGPGPRRTTSGKRVVLVIDVAQRRHRKWLTAAEASLRPHRGWVAILWDMQRVVYVDKTPSKAAMITAYDTNSIGSPACALPYKRNIDYDHGMCNEDVRGHERVTEPFYPYGFVL